MSGLTIERMGAHYRIGKEAVTLVRDAAGEPVALLSKGVRASGNAPLPRRYRHLPVRRQGETEAELLSGGRRVDVEKLRSG